MPKQVRVTLDNRTASFDCSPETQVELKKYFRYRSPNYRWSPKYRQHWIDEETGETRRLWDGYVNLFKYSQTPTGLFLALQDSIEKEKKFKFVVTDKRERPAFCLTTNTNGLVKRARPYQIRCVGAMRQASNTGGLILVGTGAGKTFTTALYFFHLEDTALFIVDELTLLKQAHDEMVSVLGKQQVGEVGMGEFNPKRVTIATIQTLHRHRKDRDFRKWLRSIGVVVIDEIHLALNRRNVDVVNLARPKAVFGLTATLELKKMDVYMRALALAGPSIFEYSLKEGQDEGYLSKGIMARILYKKNGSVVTNPGSRKQDVEYDQLITFNTERNLLIESLIREGIRRKRKIVVLVRRRPHIRGLSQQLKDIKHQVLHGEFSREDRFKAKQAMDSGKLDLIITSRIFEKGVDIKTVNTILDATGSSSSNNAKQRFGRGSRMSEGKSGLLYLDVADVSPVPKGFRGFNRFSTAAKRRKRALEAIGIPILNISSTRTASEMYDIALKKLSKITSTSVSNTVKVCS